MFKMLIGLPLSISGNITYIFLPKYFSIFTNFFSMKPIKFEQCNKHLDFENGQELDFFQDELTGKVIMLWQFDEEERARIAETGQLFISQVLGQTAVPMLDVPFRELTEEEREMLLLVRKKAEVKVRQEQRRKPNAKRVKLKAIA